VSFRALLAFGLLALAPTSPEAAMEFDGDGWRAEIGGQLRLLGTFTREVSANDFLLRRSTHREDSGLFLTRARLNAQATFGERLFAQVTYDTEFRTGSALRSLAFELGSEIGTQTWLDADRPFSRSPDGHLRHALYRAWVRYEGDRFDVTVGRQRIALGRGRLWNPTDLFNPIFPLAIEGDQRIGQDSIVTRLRPTRSLRVVGIWAPQDDPDDHRAAIRLELHRQEVDAALMAGRFLRDWVFGGDFAASVRGAAVRGEATFTDLETGGRIWQVVGSVDYNLQIGTGIYVLVEHLYNENRIDPNAFSTPPPFLPRETALRLLARAQTLLLNRITTIVRNQTGFQVGYDLTPILRGDFLVLYDWDGPSAAVVPALRYVWRDEVEIALAAQIFVGRDGRTEYGDRSPLLLLQLDAYF
jgi:hypothetical protein